MKTKWAFIEKRCLLCLPLPGAHGPFVSAVVGVAGAAAATNPSFHSKCLGKTVPFGY